MNLLIRNGRLVDPSQSIDGAHDILIIDGKVEKIGKALRAPGSVAVLEARGLVVAPGFIDLHTHLREPGQEHKETIRSGTAAAVAGGFTAICAMANTVPPNDERAVTEMIVAEASRNGACRVYPIGAVSRGLKGEELAELADLHGAGCVGFSDDGVPIANSMLMRRALEYAKMLGLPVIVHEEDPYLAEGGVMHEGFFSTLLGMTGIPAAAEETMAMRDVQLAELTGGHLHVAHISTRGAVDAVRGAKKRNVHVTCEAAPHHFSLTDEAVRSFSTNVKMKPPLRSRDHLEAVLAAIADGTVDVIATDHAPHHPDEKDVEFDLAPFGIIGLETAFLLACDRLLQSGTIDLVRLVELMSCNPARIFSLPGGTLKEGSPGDVTIVDPNGTTTVTSFRSKSSNSPFRGEMLRGRVHATIVGGILRYKDAIDVGDSVQSPAAKARPVRGKKK